MIETYSMYNDLVRILEQLSAKQEVVVVVISGHGGSGKSTLAERLAVQFGVYENQVIRLDHLYSKNHMQAQGLFELHDWATIIDILKHARTLNA